MPVIVLLLEAVMPGSLHTPMEIKEPNAKQLVVKKNWCSCKKTNLYALMIAAFLCSFSLRVQGPLL